MSQNNEVAVLYPLLRHLQITIGITAFGKTLKLQLKNNKKFYYFILTYNNLVQ